MRGNKAGSSGLAPVVAPRASWSLTLGLIVATLRDLCIDPGVVNHEVRQPFWRPPRDWRD